MVTSRNGPIRRIGILSMLGPSMLAIYDRESGLFEGEPERICQRRLGHHSLQVDTQMDDGLRNLRSNSADDAIRTHHPNGGYGLEQMLGSLSIYGGHSGDVDDR